MIKYNSDEKIITVLIVEDNLGDFVLIEDFLLEKFIKINIHHCKDHISTIEFLKNRGEEISIILIDLHLPDLSGNQLVEDILSHSSHIPIIILTSYSDLDVAKKSLQIGVYDYLIKDEINPNLLHKSIEFSLSRKNYIQQLETERISYENLFNFSPQPMWLLDYDSFCILNSNYSAILRYGYSIEEFKELSFLDLHPENERTCIRELIESKEKESVNFHFTHIFKNGSEIKVDVYCKEIDPNGKSRKVILQANDITDTLNHIETIEFQNKKLENIAWTQSHIVRTPLSRILGIINLIEENKESEEELQFWLKELKNSTIEMDDVVKKIVEEARNFKSNRS